MADKRHKKVEKPRDPNATRKFKRSASVKRIRLMSVEKKAAEDFFSAKPTSWPSSSIQRRMQSTGG
jgi:hypothetical protein